MNLKQLEPPVTHFMADAMLGRLARWLRILGYDTDYEKDVSDEALIDRVLSENRWLLTRDGYLAQRKVLRGRHTLIKSDNLEGQLQQLHRELHIVLDVIHHKGYRCADCNVVLIPIPHDQAAPLIPPFVAQQYREFLQCPHCRRVFWPGTHWQDLLGRLVGMRDGDGAEPR
ncbi:MAG TPA: Mut7-C RNAse domain-containing protein [Nitrospira sp.]|nr:Mut7-C RNAse domain-containing protein [Nitrospira sp.]